MPFRDQHIGHFQTLASIRPPRLIVAVALMLTLAVAMLVLLLTFTPWVQTTSGPGVVSTRDPNDRVQEINALVSGRIDRWYVRDGDRVAAGDPIVRIADNDPQLIERLSREREQLTAGRDAARAALRTAQIDLERTRGLFEDGLAARRDFEAAAIRVEDMRASLAAAEASIERQETELSRQSVQTVRAPREGTILRINGGASATYVSAGDPVAMFQPEGAERVVELYVDGRDVALVAPGRRVMLEFEGWPAVQFSGWPSVAVGTFPGRVLSIDPTAQPDGRFRVLVAEGDETPWPGPEFVRFGASARGWVLLDEVRLGYELWRQLNNFPPQYSTGTTS
ncbi:efflux RND transporter periplasmic adaptor subunit [Parvularcula dongshanensis]|uniref:Multidrug efflux pump subunit AcrA (Membrane-fusion protein) n=1 Tax=Parvularcula dongshanensis TaxID=1173995 RepID=A0A840I624_9PROT|nr:HlyD family efflux transporter periplasmic adaptor subunit [Parvularcula dongshanensis]MBB4660277.1 multidrug efflux pump subunit AcrA (membrane-fusion protein) [Parvularcula dongshanensis]